MITRASHHLCRECDYKRRRGTQITSTTSSESLSTLEQIGSNAVSLVQSLPVHSHHRAPLLYHLAQGLTSTAASSTFGSSSSYIRDCKRKNPVDSDLLIAKYSSDVKRMKLPAEVIQHLFNYLKNYIKAICHRKRKELPSCA